MHYIGQSLTALDYFACKLRWTASMASDLDGYFVYMSEADRNHFRRMTPAPVTEAEWVSPPLRYDMNYYFYITAVDTSGNESYPSNTFHFQPPNADNDIAIVEPPKKIVLLSSGGYIEELPFPDFFTSFTLGE